MVETQLFLNIWLLSILQSGVIKSILIFETKDDHKTSLLEQDPENRSGHITNCSAGIHKPDQQMRSLWLACVPPVPCLGGGAGEMNCVYTISMLCDFVAVRTVLWCQTEQY